MPMASVPDVTLTPVAYFPERYFIENLAVRSDGSVLITVLSSKELWWVPPFTGSGLVEPVLAHSFKQLPMPMGIAEAEPDVFIVCLSDGYTTHESHLARVDLTGWTPGDPVSPEVIYTFDDRVRALNGACLLGPGVMAIADCAAGLIWRVDLADGARKAAVRIWLADNTMAWDPDSHIAGDPFTPVLAGPSSLAWGRSPGDHGRVAYVTTDGGVTALPPDGIIRKSALLRAELHPAKENS